MTPPTFRGLTLKIHWVRRTKRLRGEGSQEELGSISKQFSRTEGRQEWLRSVSWALQTQRGEVEGHQDSWDVISHTAPQGRQDCTQTQEENTGVDADCRDRQIAGYPGERILRATPPLQDRILHALLLTSSRPAIQIISQKGSRGTHSFLNNRTPITGHREGELPPAWSNPL